MTFSSRFPFSLLYSELVQADARTPVIRRTNYNVCTVEYVIRGAGFLRTDGEYFSVPADSVYFLHKGSNHEYWPSKSDPWHKLCFVADGPLMEYFLRIYNLENVHFIPDARELRSYFESFLQMDRTMPRFNERASVVFHGFAEACGAHFQQQENKISDPIRKLREAMNESNPEKPFRLAQYCQQVELNPSYAVRAFRKAYGCSPVEYLLRKKLETAQRMLRYSQLSVKEIAAYLQFCDQYHFSAFYKKRTGESPSSFREKFK